MDSKQDRPTLSVVIVNYCSGSLVAEKLRSLESQPGIETIVVDNASRDDSLDRARAIDSSCLFLQNEQNLGFSRAVNIGAARTRGRFICLLNPDAEINPSDLLTLCSLMERNPGIGVIAPNIQHVKGIKVMEAGWAPTIRNMAMHVTGLSRLSRSNAFFRGFHARPIRSADGMVEMDWVSGAILVSRRSVWETLHGLDERWFMYTEDIEYCHRVKKLGFSVAVAASVSASHSVGASAGAPDVQKSRSKSLRQREIDTLWIVTLFEHYRDDLSRSWIGPYVWTMVVGAGLVLRMVVFHARSLLARDQLARTRFRFMTSKFRWSIKALFAASLRGQQL